MSYEMKLLPQAMRRVALKFAPSLSLIWYGVPEEQTTVSDEVVSTFDRFPVVTAGNPKSDEVRPQVAET